MQPSCISGQPVDGSLDVGYRCGDNDLNDSPPDWERVIYHAD
ncbi:hypothetical protein [Sorangium sp. So ce363]